MDRIEIALQNNTPPDKCCFHYNAKLTKCQAEPSCRQLDHIHASLASSLTLCETFILLSHAVIKFETVV